MIAEVDYATVELTMDEALSEDRTEFPAVTFEVVQETGPASGWPVVRVTGPDRDVMAFLNRAGFYLEDVRVD